MTVDISEYVAGICERIGKEPGDVAYIAITPWRMRVRIYDKNESGDKFVHTDKDNPHYGQVAQRTESFDVKT